MGIIQAAIPFFFLAIGIELLLAVLLGRKVYRLNDSINDLSCGIFQQLFGLVFKLAMVAVYALSVEYLSIQALFSAPEWTMGAPLVAADNVLGFALNGPAVFTWVFAFFAYDLAYYWAHRKMHETNLGWATHVVHHSSEEYNLTVALRQGTFQTFFSVPFYVPLAVLGIPWEVFLTVGALNLIYQFWVHTRLVGKMGPLEWIMNTPSHHRVHHGKNPKYIDRNHAGVFIIWDRMFGTFQPEEEEPVYGITTPLNTWNPVAANLHFFQHLWGNLRRARSLKDAWRILWNKPGWRPDYQGGPLLPQPVDRTTYRKFHIPLNWRINLYVLLQFAAIVPVTLYTLMNATQLPLGQAVGLGFLVVLSLTNLGGIMERKRWAWLSELGRLSTLLFLTGGLWWKAVAPLGVAAGVGGFLLLAAVYLFALRKDLNRGLREPHPEVAPAAVAADETGTKATGQPSSS